MATTADRASQRTLTPAVVGAAAFVVICAFISIAFVAARGGLALPLASPSAPVVAVASPSPAATANEPTASPSAAPSPGIPTSPPGPTPGGPTQPPTGATPTPKPDPLAALPGCPGHPGCYVYTVRRGDTLGRIADRYDLPYPLVLALNPELVDPSIIVIGQPIYLARDLFARLDPCPKRDACYLYVVQPGDRLSTIAGRYGLTMTAILELNPSIVDPNTIYSGQVIRLPDPTP